MTLSVAEALEELEHAVLVARAERDAALAALGRVRALHRPWTGGLFPECEICGPDTGRAADDQYPCATVQALDAIDAPEEPARHG
jgi:hypothetical protein